MVGVKLEEAIATLGKNKLELCKLSLNEQFRGLGKQGQGPALLCVVHCSHDDDEGR